MRFQLVLITCLAAVGLGAPVEEKKFAIRTCPGGGPGTACPEGFFLCHNTCVGCGGTCSD
ncbi:hypothetical protein PUNSTDRAFT_134489 [Punctularia strigosozonata HHB-11173 SS5]|uniref:uncharacterized protein n=1 Tax=Punctularia strigosozonata (strain HHB-11173) TaxID=741275 RepID=UPI0004416EB3|nr:uncharacterized protein PUNSTDRAFT_134489 [Punctularia strigosozonata HHB-11173 SS5]EIN09336.1 hypothetical protein PUNSTDRAFT_134489 [Punctularia strigosozonata HHB-11173 SS5]